MNQKRFSGAEQGIEGQGRLWTTNFHKIYFPALPLGGLLAPWNVLP